MALVAKRKLSGSTDGRGIKVVATASPGTTIHTAVAGTTAGTFDEVWLYATSSTTTAVALTVQWGSTTAPDDSITVNVSPSGSGLIAVIPGLVLQNGGIVRAFAGTTNVIMIHGFVNSITA